MATARRVPVRAVGWFGPNRSFAERVGLFTAAAVVAPSFEPGLQPRRTLHQAIATGVVSASTLSTTTVMESMIESFARVVTRDRGDRGSLNTRWAIATGANAVALATGAGIMRALPPRPGERGMRGLLRVAGHQTARTGLVGVGLGGLLWAMDLTADRNPRLEWVRHVPVALPLGIGVAALRIRRMHKHAKAYGDATIADVAPGRSAGLAVGVGAGVLALEASERLVAHGVSRLVATAAPSYEVLAAPLGHIVGLGALAAAGAAGYEYAVRSVESAGAAVEPAYEQPATSPLVSGGPGSLVTFDTLSREGRRFVNMALSAQDIEEVMGEPARDPVRVFVGLATSEVVDDRVDAVMDELERTGAFERSVLCFASPTGSGYINYVLAEALEYFTRGDCATVGMQYSLRPSFLSLDRVGLGVEQNRALMHALTGRLAGIPEEQRPRFVLFGESLGAHTMQDVYRHRRATALERDHIAAAIFLGTPYGTQAARGWRRDPERADPDGVIVEVDSFEEFEALPAEQRAKVRYVLLSHHDDPIPKFGLPLTYQQPDWLGPPEDRAPGIPRSARWRPFTTFVLTLVDLINAMDVKPGTFGRRGHDYREDIARFVAAVFRLPVSEEQMARVEAALRRREVEWAARREVTEQFLRAREEIQRQFKTWGVTSPADPQVAELLQSLLDSSPGPLLAQPETPA